MNLTAVLTLVVIGGVLGLVLGVANTLLFVEEDNRVVRVAEMLPGVNCGACGYPGCAGFASALVEGEAKKVSTCVVSQSNVREEIVNYLKETPGADGKTVDVSI